MSGNPPKETDFHLDRIEDAIQSIQNGEIIIVVDDEDRENEGDFICAAACVTPEIINFMATHGRGLICAPIDEKRADELDLHMMVRQNTSLHETAFTVSIDLIGQGCTTGISAYDRATGIRALIDPATRPEDFARPGHIFPLRAKTGGVLRRTGHTEAAIDLARLAGFFPAGVLVEILNEDGSMARLPQLINIARRYKLRIISIKDLVAYRMRTERIVTRDLESQLDTPYGPLRFVSYCQVTTGDMHLAICKGNWNPGEVVPVRMHSASIPAQDIFGFLFGHHDEKLQLALQKLDQLDNGVIVYLRHGEKVLNLRQKLEWLINPEKPEIPPHEYRDIGVGSQILRDLGIEKISLITNQTSRPVGIEGYGLEICGHIPLDGAN